MAESQSSNKNTKSLFHKSDDEQSPDIGASTYLEKIAKLFSIFIDIDQRNKRIHDGSKNI